MSVKQIFNTSAELDYPTVLPTLDLDFANTKTLDPRITFTRASGGSYVGGDGLIKTAGVNEARFDHDPYTGESLGFLVEEARTNLSIYSEDFSNTSYWTFTSQTVVSNAAISPNKTVTADNIIPAAGTNAVRYLYYSVNPYSMSVNTTYTSSVFVKKNGLRYFALQVHDNASGSGHRAGFDLDNGVVVASTVNNMGSAGGATASIVPYPNGWYRCIITGTTSVTGTTGRTAFSFTSSLDANASVSSISADGTSGGFIWGMQVEAGAFPTSYIPTEGSSRTRAADVASITGKNFSSWFNPSVGTFFTDSTNDNLTSNIARSAYDTTNTVAFSLGSGGDRVYTPILGYLSNNTIVCFLFSFNGSGTEFGPTLQNTLSNTADVSRVCVYTDIVNNLYAISTAGQINVIGRPLDVSRTGQLAYTLAQSMVIGYNSNYYGNYIGRIKRITYYPKRLTNQQLQALTT